MNPAGGVISSTQYANVISEGLRNPRSEVWNLEVDRQVTSDFLVRVAYQQRNTVHDSYLNPMASGATGILALSGVGSDFYKEFQVTGGYRIHRSTLNASYVRSRAYGDLNDFNQFFGNDPQAVIQPNQRGRLNFDAPNRLLAWGEIAAPWKLTFAPVLDTHTGFPYSTVDQYREFVGRICKSGAKSAYPKKSTRRSGSEFSTFSITPITAMYKTISTAIALASSLTV